MIVITNQSGIARGYFTHSKLHEIHNKMKMDLSKCGARIDDIYYCPCHPNKDCQCRKPGLDLFREAEKMHVFDKVKSFMVGDSAMDILAGNNYGLSTILLSNSESSCQADYVCKDLQMAVDWILNDSED